MSYRIDKEYSWEMAHRISNHQGKCWNIHGHSYVCVVFLGRSGLDINGMVVDYYKLDIVMKPLIEELDHCCIVYTEDKLLCDIMTFIEPLNSKKMKFVLVPFETTAENIAKYIYDKVREKLDCVESVVVKETKKCGASYGIAEV